MSRPLLDRSPEAILGALTRLLVAHPDASLGDLARMIGIGRTTLHRLYPTREALLRAAAERALGQLRDLDARAELPRLFTNDLPAEESWDRIRGWVGALIPMGPQLTFLLRARELERDDDLARAVQDLDVPLLGALSRAAERGELVGNVPPAWLLASLQALIFAAWQEVGEGRLAPRDAAGLVLRSWRQGLSPSTATG